MRSLTSLWIALSLAACGGEAAPAPTASVSASGAAGSAKVTASSDPAPKRTHAELARAYGERIVAKDFAGAASLLAPEIAKAVPAADLEKAWTTSFGEAGEPVAVESVTLLELGATDVALVRLALEHGTMQSR